MITIAFIFWGIGPKDNPTVVFAAQVEDEKITLDEFWRAYDNEYKRLREQNKTPEEIEKLNLEERVLNSLIDRTVLLIAAQKAGIKVTREELQEAIINTPYFQRNGVFDQEIYRRALKLNRITPQIFERSMRDDMIISKMTNFISETAELSEDEQKIIDSIKGENRNQLIQIFRSNKANQMVKAYIESMKRQMKITVNRDQIS
jgi:peptidyl-prolyl cis-trans isomerase D